MAKRLNKKILMCLMVVITILSFQFFIFSIGDADANSTGPQISYSFDASNEDWATERLIHINLSTTSGIKYFNINDQEVDLSTIVENRYDFTYSPDENTILNDIKLSLMDNNNLLVEKYISLVSLKIDNIKPHINVNNNGYNEQWTKDNVTFTLNQDNLINDVKVYNKSGIKYYYKRAEDTDYTLIQDENNNCVNYITFKDSEKNENISFKAVSGAGLTSNIIDNNKIYIDKTAPQKLKVKFDNNVYSLADAANIEFSFDNYVTDNLSNVVIYYTLDGTKPTVDTTTIINDIDNPSISLTQTGLTEIKFIAIDEMGFESPVSTSYIKVKDNLNITVDEDSLHQIYDENGKSIVVTNNEGNESSTYITYNDSTVLPVNAGIYNVCVIVETDTAYGEYKGTLVIDKAVANINVDEGSKTQTYGNVNQLEVSVKNSSNTTISENIIILYKINGEFVTSIPTNAGTYEVKINIASQNYSASEVVTELIVNKADIEFVNTGCSNYVYSATQIKVTPFTTNPSNLEISFNYYIEHSVSSDITIVPLEGLPINVGAYYVEAVYDGVSNNNYNPKTSPQIRFEITPKQISINHNYSIKEVKEYDGNTDVLIEKMPTIDGILGDDEVYLSMVANYKEKDSFGDNDIEIKYALLTEFDGVDYPKSANYNITVKSLTDTTGNIIPRKLFDIKVNETYTKVYDATQSVDISALTLTTNNIVDGENIIIKISESTFLVNGNVGNDKQIESTLVFDTENSTNSTANYELPSKVVSNADINKRVITLSQDYIDVTAKKYDGLLNAKAKLKDNYTVNIQNTVNDELVTLEIVEANYNSKNVYFDNNFVVVSFNIIDYADNYTIENVTKENQAILPRKVSVENTTYNEKIYNKDTDVDIVLGNLSFFVKGDDVQISYTANFADVNVSEDVDISVQYSFTGADIENYVFTTSETINGKIKPYVINVTLTNTEQIFDGEVKNVSYDTIVCDKVFYTEDNPTFTIEYILNEATISPLNVNDYIVNLISSDNNYIFESAIKILKIKPAQAIMELNCQDSNHTYTYNGNTPNIINRVYVQNGDNQTDVSDDQVTIKYSFYILKNDPTEDFNWETALQDDTLWKPYTEEGDKYTFPVLAGYYKVYAEIEAGNYITEDQVCGMQINKVEAIFIFKEESKTQVYGSEKGLELITSSSFKYAIKYYQDDEEVTDNIKNVGQYKAKAVSIDRNYFGESEFVDFEITPKDASEELNIEISNDKFNLDGDKFKATYYKDMNLLPSDFNIIVNNQDLECEIVLLDKNDDTIILNNIANAGEYRVKGKIINNENLYGEKVFNISIAKMEVEIIVSEDQLNQVYDGLEKDIEFTSSNSDVNIALINPYYPAIENKPIDAGDYEILFEIDHKNYVYKSPEEALILHIAKCDAFINVKNRIEINFSNELYEFTKEDVEVLDLPENVSSELIYTYVNTKNINDVYVSTDADNPQPLNSGTYNLTISFANPGNFSTPSYTSIYVINKTNIEITNIKKVFEYNAKDLIKEDFNIKFNIPNVTPFVTFYRCNNSTDEFIDAIKLNAGEYPNVKGKYFISISTYDGGQNYNDIQNKVYEFNIVLAETDVKLESYQFIYTGQNILPEFYFLDVNDNKIVIPYEGNNIQFSKLQGSNYIGVSNVTDVGNYTALLNYSNDAYSVSGKVINFTVIKKDISEEISLQTDLDNLIFDNEPVKIIVDGIDSKYYRTIYRNLENSQTLNYVPYEAGKYSVEIQIKNTHKFYKGSKTFEYEIHKKDLNIKANDFTVKYGEEIELTYNCLDAVSDKIFINKPEIHIKNNSGLDVTEFSVLTCVGEYDLILTAGSSRNYNLLYQNGELKITKAEIELIADDVTIKFGESKNYTAHAKGYKYNDASKNIFFKTYSIHYKKSKDEILDEIPTKPGVYSLIPVGGECDNYDIVYKEGKLTINKLSICVDNNEVNLDGNFHPDTEIKIDKISNSSKFAIQQKISKNSILLRYFEGTEFSLLVGDEIPEFENYTYKVKIPSKLKGKDFSLFYMDKTGKFNKLSFKVEGDFAVGQMNESSGRIVFARPINIKLILIIIGGIVVLIIAVVVGVLLSKKKNEEPPMVNTIDPTQVAPNEEMEDEDAAFDAYIDQIVEGKIKLEIEEEESEEDVELNINEEDYSEEEIKKLKEKALKMKKHKSVEDRITQQVEQNLVENLEKEIDEEDALNEENSSEDNDNNLDNADDNESETSEVVKESKESESEEKLEYNDSNNETEVSEEFVEDNETSNDNNEEVAENVEIENQQNEDTEVVEENEVVENEVENNQATETEENDITQEVEEEKTDEYIIQNELYAKSNTITYEEAIMLYPNRQIKKIDDVVYLELCFESALNISKDKFKYIYSEIKNEFNSYQGVESKMFKSGEAFKGGLCHSIIRMRNSKPVVFMNIPKNLIDEDIKYIDHSDDPKFKNMPIEFIINNGKQLTLLRKTIKRVMGENNLIKNENYEFVNFVDKYPYIENATIKVSQ